MRGLVLIVAAALVACLGGASSNAGGGEVRIFAAASLADAMGDVGRRMKEKTGITTKLVLAGSSTLARQIEAGARADIFVSADEAWMDYLAGIRAISSPGGKALLSNAIVLVSARPGLLRLDLSKESDWLARLGPGRIAMGDPEHVPVGRYARSALEGLGAWKVVRRRIAVAPDTRAALALVERGEAVAGIVYATDAAASKSVHIVGRFPASVHPKISYVVAVVKGANAAVAPDALAFLLGDEAANIFRKHGFIVP